MTPPPVEFARAMPVGEAARVETCVFVVTLRCRCQPDNGALVIAGTGGVARCEHCGAQYAVGVLTYNRQRHPTNVTLQLMRFGPAAAPRGEA